MGEHPSLTWFFWLQVHYRYFWQGEEKIFLYFTLPSQFYRFLYCSQLAWYCRIALWSYLSGCYCRFIVDEYKELIIAKPIGTDGAVESRLPSLCHSCCLWHHILVIAYLPKVLKASLHLLSLCVSQLTSVIPLRRHTSWNTSNAASRPLPLIKTVDFLRLSLVAYRPNALKALLDRCLRRNCLDASSSLLSSSFSPLSHLPLSVADALHQWPIF